LPTVSLELVLLGLLLLLILLQAHVLHDWGQRC
jgi:hypothetical protein